jgi:hypothetical protein
MADHMQRLKVRRQENSIDRVPRPSGCCTKPTSVSFVASGREICIDISTKWPYEERSKRKQGDHGWVNMPVIEAPVFEAHVGVKICSKRARTSEHASSKLYGLVDRWTPGDSCLYR